MINLPESVPEFPIKHLIEWYGHPPLPFARPKPEFSSAVFLTCPQAGRLFTCLHPSQASAEFLLLKLRGCGEGSRPGDHGGTRGGTPAAQGTLTGPRPLPGSRTGRKHGGVQAVEHREPSAPRVPVNESPAAPDPDLALPTLSPSPRARPGKPCLLPQVAAPTSPVF